MPAITVALNAMSPQEVVEDALTRFPAGTLVTTTNAMPSALQPWIHPIRIGRVVEPTDKPVSFNQNYSEIQYCGETGVLGVSFDHGFGYVDTHKLITVPEQVAAMNEVGRIRYFLGEVAAWRLERPVQDPAVNAERGVTQRPHEIALGMPVIAGSELPSAYTPWTKPIEIGRIIVSPNEPARAIHQAPRVWVEFDDGRQVNVRAHDVLPVTPAEIALTLDARVEHFLGILAAENLANYKGERFVAPVPVTNESPRVVEQVTPVVSRASTTDDGGLFVL